MSCIKCNDKGYTVLFNIREQCDCVITKPNVGSITWSAPFKKVHTRTLELINGIVASLETPGRSIISDQQIEYIDGRTKLPEFLMRVHIPYSKFTITMPNNEVEQVLSIPRLSEYFIIVTRDQTTDWDMVVREIIN